MDAKPAALAEKLGAIESYRKQFEQAFGGQGDAQGAGRGMATFERSLTSDDTPFDRYLRGDKRAMPERAVRGMRLFFGDARCGCCHKGPNFSDDSFHNVGTAGKDDLGRRAVTKKGGDHGAFRTPPLREIGRTAPSTCTMGHCKRSPRWCGTTTSAA